MSKVLDELLTLNTRAAPPAPKRREVRVARPTDNVVQLPTRGAEPALAPSPSQYALPAKHLGDIVVGMHGEVPFYFRSGKKDGVSMPLCCRYEVVGGKQFMDRGKECAVEIAFEFAGRERKTVLVTAADLGSRAVLIAKLRGAGMVFTPSGADFIYAHLLQFQPAPLPCYDWPGLRDGNFILPSGLVCVEATPGVTLSEKYQTLKVPPQAGTLEDWRRGATAISEAKSNSVKVALAAGLMGPLLAAAGAPPVTLIFTGRTTAGKSWRQKIKAAIAGPPEVAHGGQMRTCRATENALETPMMMASGTGLDLDEMRLMNAKTVSAVIFQVYSGAGKQRAFTTGDARTTKTWDGFVLSLSTEVPLAQLLRQEGEVQAGGHSVRMLECDLDGDVRLSDAQHKEANLCVANYGHAIFPFVHEVHRLGYFDDPYELHERVEAIVDALPGTHDDIARRAAMPLGFMQVAAEIAISIELLTSDFNPEAVVGDLWRAYQNSDLAAVDPADRAVDTLIERLTSNRGVDVIDLTETTQRQNRAAVAWIDQTGANCEVLGERVYVLRSKKLGELSGGFAPDKAVRNRLEDAGYLVRGYRSDGHDADGKRKETMSSTWPYWPTLGKGPFLVLRAKMVEGAD